MIKDNKPGHYNQSYAILKACEHLYPNSVSVEEVEVKIRVKLLRVFLNFFLNMNFRYTALLTIFYTFSSKIVQKPDIIISAGGDTSFLNAILAKKYKAINFFAGSLRRLNSALFSAVFSSDTSLKNNITLQTPISVITFDAIKESAKSFLDKHELRKQEYWSFLLGGSDAGYVYKKEDIENFITQIKLIQRNYPDIGLLISTSRRTENFVEDMLKVLDVDYLVLYNEDPQKVVKAFLGLSSRVFVSEDSITMVAEAIAASKEVYTLLPKVANPTENDLGIIRRHQEKGYIQRVNIEDIGDFLDNSYLYKRVSVESFREIAQKISPYIESFGIK